MDSSDSASPKDIAKLQALRQLDGFRRWDSLDDVRRCLRCGKKISGREMRISGGGDGAGPVRANCPTRGCDSIPLDWALDSNGSFFGSGRDGHSDNAVKERDA